MIGKGIRIEAEAGTGAASCMVGAVEGVKGTLKGDQTTVKIPWEERGWLSRGLYQSCFRMVRFGAPM